MREERVVYVVYWRAGKTEIHRLTPFAAEVLGAVAEGQAYSEMVDAVAGGATAEVDVGSWRDSVQVQLAHAHAAGLITVRPRTEIAKQYD